MSSPDLDPESHPEHWAPDLHINETAMLPDDVPVTTGQEVLRPIPDGSTQQLTHFYQLAECSSDEDNRLTHAAQPTPYADPSLTDFLKEEEVPGHDTSDACHAAPVTEDSGPIARRTKIQVHYKYK